MITRLDHSHWRNLRHSGFVVVLLAAILSASYKPLGPRIDPGDFGEWGRVVVARIDIPLGAKIMAGHLALAAIPNRSAPEGAFRSLEQIVGRVAITPIGIREPVTKIKLAPEGTGAGISAVIPEGYRAITVKVHDVVGVSGFIMPGSFVDVVCVIVPATSQSGVGQNPISKIVLQDIKVLASGANIDSPDNEREPARVGAVTLQVTPSQAEKLVLATTQGELKLVIRNYGPGILTNKGRK
jgi:pilus assembly protein CpaB